MIILLNYLNEYPLILASNRDEFFQRDSLPPHLWSNNIFAGKDKKKGGSWLGINSYGLVAGVVNRYTGTRDPEKRSRGHLVIDCLRLDSIKMVKTYLSEEDLSQYNPFNLFGYQDREAFILTNYPHTRLVELEEGIYFITNCDPFDKTDEKKIYLRARFKHIPDKPEDILSILIHVCKDHNGPKSFPFPVCVHLDDYGTVSSSIIFVGVNLNHCRFYYNEGPPCKGQYRDLTRDMSPLFE